MKSIEYMDAVRARQNLTSDYQLAQYLNVTQPATSKWRKGKATIGDDQAPAIAKALDVPVEKVIADLHAERENNPALVPVWQAIAAHFARAACMLAALAGFNITLAPRADAAATPTLTAPLFCPDAARNINSRVAALVRIICSVARKAARFAYFGTRHGASWQRPASA